VTSQKMKSIMARGRIKSETKKHGRALRLDSIPYLDQIMAAGYPTQDGGREVLVAAVDPSISHTGWCLSRWTASPQGVISVEMLSAGVSVIRRPLPGLLSVRHMADAILEHIHDADFLILEYPEVYGTAQKKDPNDLLPLVGVLGGLVTAKTWNGQLAYHPSEWKGLLQKEVHQARYLPQMPQYWQDKYLPDHNAADAALLMFWQVQQLVPLSRVTFSGCI
jgi:hypothetical protein